VTTHLSGDPMKNNIEQKQNYLCAAYDQYADQIYRYCLLRIRSPEQAEDILQETFIKVWKYLLRDKEIQDIRSFLFRVSRNLLIDHYRKRATKNKREEPLEEAWQKKQNLKHLSVDQETINETQEDIKDVYQTISLLPNKYQDVIIFRYLEEMPPKEIAKVLNTTPKNISATIDRAKRRIKKIRNKQ